MSKRDILRFIAIAILSTAAIFFRGRADTLIGYVAATLVVIAFWALHSLKISRLNLRAFLLILLLFGVPFLFLRQLPIFSNAEANVGPWTEEGFDPARIGSLHLSNQIAMQVYFDHHPTSEERYFKTATLEMTEDGLQYQNRGAAINPKFLPRTKAWVESNLIGKAIREKVEIVQAWLQRDFTYSLSPGVLLSRTPLDEFLFKRKQGYCEHFSASLATLLKLSGTRARVVVGFEGGAWNPLTEELTYVMADSHAWVEAYDPGFKAWVRYDPTSWVANSMARGNSNPTAVDYPLAGLVIVAVMLFIYWNTRARDPFVSLNAKLLRLETKEGMSQIGLTIAERMKRIANRFPELEPRLEKSLRLYNECYFKGDPTEESKRALLSSLNWPTLLRKRVQRSLKITRQFS